MSILQFIPYSIAGLTVLIPVSAIAQSVQFSAPAIAPEGSLVCYMRTSSGNVIDLRSLCGSNTNENQNPAAVARVQSNITPYTNLGGLNIYSRGGNVPCFGIDSQGRVCSSAGR